MDKKEIQRRYWRKHFAEIKADPVRYEEYKQKERERVRRYRLKLKSGEIKMNKNTLSNDVEELKKQIKRLKARETSRKFYEKLKKDPEKYQKYLAYHREKTARYQAAKKAEKAVVNAAEDVVNQPIPNINEPRWNWPPFATADRIISQEKVIGTANNAEDENKVEEQFETVKPIDLSDSIKEFDIKKFVHIKESEDAHSVEIAEPKLDEAYYNFREQVRRYFKDVTAEYSILNAFELYMNTYKKDLLSKIKELLNK